MSSSVQESSKSTLADVSRGPKLFMAMAHLDAFAVTILRCGLVLVLLWIGGLKFADYEADSIVPLVANSPFLNFAYRYHAPDYRWHMNKEGQLVVHPLSETRTRSF